MEFHISTTNDDDADEAIVKLIVAWMLKDKESKKVIKKFALMINGAGAALAHNVTTGDEGEREEMNNEFEWITSPKDIVTYLLESDLLIDKERLAEYYGHYVVYKELESLFNLPDADRDE